MATEVEIDAKINTANSAQTIKDLNKGLKELVSLQGQVASGSDQFKRLQKSITETEGKIGDLKDSFQTLRGSGVERVNASLSLFKEGLLNADTEKLKLGLQGVGSAMKAIPIFLLIEGVKILFDNWDKLTSLFSNSAKQIQANKDALEALNVQVAINKVNTDELLIIKEKELKQLETQGGSLQSIVDKLKEIDSLKQSNIQGEISKTDKQINNIVAELKILQEELSLTDFLPDIFGGDSTEKKTKELQKALSDLQIKRKELLNQSLKTEVDTENAIQAKIKEARDKADEASRKRISDFQAFLKEKNDQEAALTQDNIDRENKEREEALQKVIKQVEYEKAFKVYLKQQEADQLQEIEDNSEAKRRLKSSNRLAFEQAFSQKTISQKVKDIETERDTLLLNEQLTQQQRIAVIEKAEQDIFNIKTKKAQEYVGYAQQTNAVLNDLATIRTNNENYQLNQQQYAKDAAVENDSNRTQEELAREEKRTNQLLANDNLTAEQREKIEYDSETRKLAIQNNSKNAQNSLNQAFAAKENEIRKQQFQRNKTLQIVTGVINTAASVLQTLASVPYPANIPLAILAGAAGAAQTAIIASQKYDDGGFSARSAVNPVASIDTRAGSGSASPATFSPTPVSPRQFDPTQVQNAQGNKNTRVYVLQSDIADVTNKVNVIETRANFN